MKENYNLPDKGTNFGQNRNRFLSGKWLASLLVLCLFGMQQVNAQTLTTILDPAQEGGFEVGTTFESNGWTAVNATPNAWVVGAVPAWFTGAGGAYISNNAGAAWNYTNNVINASAIYTDVTFPENSDVITLKFDWRGNGNDGNWDNLQVYLVDTSITPTTAGPTGTNSTTTGWTGYTDGTTGFYLTRINGSTTPTTTTVVSYNLTAAQRTYVAGATKRLVFVWKNDVSGGANPPASIDNISLVSTTYTCYPPTAITVTLPTNNGATIDWTPPASTPGLGYEYYISTTNTAPAASQTPTASTENEGVVLTNLPSNTTHYLWVRSKCTETEKSLWSSSVSFTTLCDIYNLAPSYTNSFTVFPGVCWTRSNAGTIATGPTGTGSGNWTSKNYLNGSGNNSAVFNLYGNTTVDSHWLISPAIDLGSTTDYRLKYNVGLTQYNSTATGTTGIIGSDLIDVLISEDAGLTWSVLTTYNSDNVPPATGATEIFDLSGYSGVIKIAFLVTDNLDLTSAQDADFFIDEFTIEPIPSCDAPIGLIVDDVTLDSAQFTWSPGQTLPANGYQYVVSETNTVPAGEGTAISSTTVTLSLQPSTVYYAWVRAICAPGNQSSWTTPVMFRTKCDVGSVPYTVDMESVVTPALPGCIVVENGNGDDKTWQSNAAQTGITGKVMSYSYHGTNDADDWFFLRGLNLTAGASYRLKFKYKDSGYVEKLRVALGQDAESTAMVTELFDVATAGSSTSTSKAIDFTVPVSGTYYIGFQAHSDADMFNLYVGEISVNVTPVSTVDFANLQSIMVSNNAVETIQKCQSVDVYAQAFESGVTEPDGQASGLLAWIGYSPDNTDPSTWPESAWSVAAYSGDAGTDGNNDEFKKSYASLALGTKYFASRFQLNEGPYKYGATSGFWDENNNPNMSLEVVNPVAINAGNDVAICAGESVTLNVTSQNANYTYVWSTTGNTASISVSPVTTTSYTVTGTDTATGCTTTDVVTVTVNDSPTAIVFGAASYAICNGTTQALSATGGAVSIEVFTEDFNATTNNWVAENASTGGTPVNGDWTLRNSGYTYGSSTVLTFNSNDVSQFYMANSDAQGVGSVMATSLTSPAFDLSGYVGANLTFYHYYRFSSGESAKVQASVDGGVTWTDVNTYTTTQGTSSAFVKATLNMDTFAGQANVQIRFKYAATWDYYWAIDNVVVSGSKPQISWAPQTDLFIDANATIPYTVGTFASVVYVKGTASTPNMYTASAQNATQCGIEATVSVAVAPAVDAPTGVETQDFTNTLDSFVVSGTNLIWYDAATGGNVLAGSTLPVTGTAYYVSQTVNGCESSTRLKVIAGQNLTIPGQAMSKLSVYPNPVSDVLVISHTEAISAVEIYNLLGQKVFEGKFATPEVKVDMNRLAAGTYVVNVLSNGLVKNIKVIKK